MGFLYIVNSQGLTKIGITADIQRRMNELKPDRIYQVVKLSREREREKKLHQLFTDKRLQGSEYFFLSWAERRRACRLARQGGERVKFPYRADCQARTHWLWWVGHGSGALVGVFGFGLAVGVAAVLIAQSRPEVQPRQARASFVFPTKSFVSV